MCRPREYALLSLYILIVGLFVLFDRRDSIRCRHQFGSDSGNADAAELKPLHPVHRSNVDGVVAVG